MENIEQRIGGRCAVGRVQMFPYQNRHEILFSYGDIEPGQAEVLWKGKEVI